MNWRKTALHRSVTEAVLGFESLGMHDTAQLGDDADGPRCHGDCVARITDIQGRKTVVPKSISHKNACAFVMGEGLQMKFINLFKEF